MMIIDFYVFVFVDIFKFINIYYVFVFVKKKNFFFDDMCIWIVIIWGFVVSGWNFIF